MLIDVRSQKHTSIFSVFLHIVWPNCCMEKPSLSSEDLVFLSDYDTMVQYEYRKEW